MRTSVWITIAYTAALPARCEQLSVSVCDLGGVRQSLIARAETETAWVFRSAHVAIVWTDCADTPTPGKERTRYDFAIRLRTDIAPRSAGTLSLEEMGRAFVSDESTGYLADAYLLPIQGTAERYQADAGALLGFVIAHELGHLILGPGHTSDGIMRARWDSREVRALQKRWLRFNSSQASSIRSFLARSGSRSTVGFEVIIPGGNQIR